MNSWTFHRLFLISVFYYDKFENAITTSWNFKENNNREIYDPDVDEEVHHNEILENDCDNVQNIDNVVIQDEVSDNNIMDYDESEYHEEIIR